jgi:hypothetical protein
MIGVSIENDMVMTNWMPTMAHNVRCHCGAGDCRLSSWLALTSGSANSSSPVGRAEPQACLLA